MADLLVQGLTVGIPGSPSKLLRDVSFALPAGTAKALIGRSGSGKSLIATSLARLLRPPLTIQAGRAVLGNLDLLSADTETLRAQRGREIFLIFQGLASLSPCLKVVDQVRRAAERRSMLDAHLRAMDALDAVGLADVAGHYPFELSGGMRQRVVIAMAFALEPQVLIADEPTTGLDPRTQFEILTNLEKLVSRTGSSLLLITHDLRAAGALCRTAIVLDSGAVIAEGSWDELASSNAAGTAILDAARRLDP